MRNPQEWVGTAVPYVEASFPPLKGAQERAGKEYKMQYLA
jgi:hypothetical protein